MTTDVDNCSWFSCARKLGRAQTRCSIRQKL